MLRMEYHMQYLDPRLCTKGRPNPCSSAVANSRHTRPDLPQVRPLGDSRYRRVYEGMLFPRTSIQSLPPTYHIRHRPFSVITWAAVRTNNSPSPRSSTGV